MHCNHCGCLLHEGEQFCPGCGKPVTAAPATPKTIPPPAPMYVASGQPSGKATASLICGLFFFVFPAALCAIILGHIAHSEIKRSGGKLIGSGRAVAGLVLGYMGVAFIPFILIVAAIAIPNLLRARIAANESTSMGSIRAINAAQVQYRASYPQIGYACALSELGGNAATEASSTSALLIDDVLASGTKSGYRFWITGCAASESDGPYDSYVVLAEPLAPNTSGTRSYCSDQTQVVKFIRANSAARCMDEGTPLE